jgi:hypothetical protein
VCVCVVSALLFGATAFAQQAPVASPYYVDCNSSIASDATNKTLHSLAAVNALRLVAGDVVLFKRGTTCAGALHPQGSGSASAAIRLGAYGEGRLPQIKALATDDAVLRLYDQQFWEIASLDLSGSRVMGVSISGRTGKLQHIYLRDLRVHDVRGEMLHKESGLIVIRPDASTAHFEDVQIDGVLASATTQWSGIFIAGASHVRVLNSMVHDVQGDGIAVFNATDALIAHSAAWHTGMQHWQTIGTPNAIWTWRCTDCMVEDNEAFLTDSPGVDGGAFDIDFGNTRNTVRRNFAHDTAGYCVSVFGAFGPTVTSVIADNLCIDNALSPKLAQRQGAMLIQTWQHGTIRGLDISGNRIYWQPPGATPAIQIGVDLDAAGVVLHDNEIWSSGPSFVNPELKYTGEHNRFETEDPFHMAFDMKPTRTAGWRLVASVPSSMLRDGLDDRVRALLVLLKSAASQFGHAGLQVSLVTDGDVSVLADDWSLAADGITIETHSAAPEFSLALISPQHQAAQEWHDTPGPVEIGLRLRQTVGPPNFGYLDIEKVAAH